MKSYKRPSRKLVLQVAPVCAVESDGIEAETRKSQASFQIIQVSSEALSRI